MERSKSLSIRSVKRYKLFLIAMVTLFFGFYVIYYTKMSGLFGILMAIIYVGLMVFYWYPNIRKFLRKIKEVSYDNENLYVREGDYEIQIPFYQVKDIEIISMDGLYKFKLYHHDQFGSEVVCKPSIWYPFNYKRIDAELNRIRSYVRKAHREYKEQIGLDRSLPSN
ncbi:hypothetical protein AAOE16_15745 [Ekhidna sp. MALMAid0563]|uniref:hypothetical protein n=1 Tax=Ekhidna sp. MALMAid0563 TaxID=3143937 RepID=UPI0032DFC1D9